MCTSTRSPLTLSFAAKVSMAPVVRDSRSSYLSPNFMARIALQWIFRAVLNEATALDAGLYRLSGPRLRPRFLLTCSRQRDDNFIALKLLINTGKRISTVPFA